MYCLFCLQTDESDIVKVTESSAESFPYDGICSITLAYTYTMLYRLTILDKTLIGELLSPTAFRFWRTGADIQYCLKKMMNLMYMHDLLTDMCLEHCSILISVHADH